eukprot:scaffold30909_cov22-Tisochrysis_lutea.AAC.2
MHSDWRAPQMHSVLDAQPGPSGSPSSLHFTHPLHQPGIAMTGESKDACYAVEPQNPDPMTQHHHCSVPCTKQVAMTGESNNIRYAVEPQFLDLGQQLFDKQLETELTIANLGKVPFNYAINTRQLSRPSVIQGGPKRASCHDLPLFRCARWAAVEGRCKAAVEAWMAPHQNLLSSMCV